MKRCSHCGENYDDRVDFCFGDGTPLEAFAQPAPQNPVQKGPSAGFLSGLDAPDAENLSGLDAPDPGGFAISAPEPAEIPSVESLEAPKQEDPGVIEAQQEPEQAEVPVGFFEPPSQTAAPAVESTADPVDAFDDLEFPSEFGDKAFGGQDFGGQYLDDYTDPTIPAPRRKKRPNWMVAAALGVVVLAMGAKILLGDSSENEASLDSQTQFAKVDITTPPAHTIASQKASESIVAPESVEPDGLELEPNVLEPNVLEPNVLEPNALVPEAVDGVGVGDEKAPDQAVKNPTPVPSKTTPTPSAPAVIQKMAPVHEKRPTAIVDPIAEDSPWGSAAEKAPSLVRIYSKPSGAIVFVDGRRRGNTPAEIELDEGPHSVRVEKDGYFSENRTLEVAKPSHLERFKLNARDQRVTVNCYGPDASKVYLDGKVVCAIPGSGTLTSGNHTFRVVTPDRFFKMDLLVKARPDGSPTPLRFTD